MDANPSPIASEDRDDLIRAIVEATTEAVLGRQDELFAEDRLRDVHAGEREVNLVTMQEFGPCFERKSRQ
jgi:hypothetical protein